MNQTPSTTSSQLPSIQEEEALRQYLQAATAHNTRRAYRSAIRQFEKWGGRLPTNSDVLVRYLLANAARLNSRSLTLHVTAISQWHRYQELSDPAQSPLVRKTLEGIRRQHGRPKHKAKALRLEHIAAMAKHLQSSDTPSLKQQRDLALILSGFFGAFRRSELVSIQVEDLHWEPEGLIIRLPRSKTDQHGAGISRALPSGQPGACPCAAIRQWLDSSDIQRGPLFRPINRWGQIKDKAMPVGAINDLLKQLGLALNFDFVPDLSSHSLRRGLSTSAARANIDFELIKKQGGWKSDATVWEYIEEGRQLEDNAATPLMQEMSKWMSDTSG
ncbi:integrase [Bacterioplanes sanyensis]|uniref:Integrase n=1 Tax=Bacterioplanes sanyensis TaxID=1249553 RepID=A0A222FLB3_9GAMM|nr:tyrosine-type recombinase/integrase [Bacterioplanes sanyensis]ASP39815.1 integrase [Bacterioplanes sanyensis]